MQEELRPLLSQVVALGRKYGAKRLMLFGSRARADFKERSDIDIAVWGMPEPSRSMFWAELEELPTLLKFDVCHISPNTDRTFLENILKDGEFLYEES